MGRPKKLINPRSININFEGNEIEAIEIQKLKYSKLTGINVPLSEFIRKVLRDGLKQGNKKAS